MANLSKIKRDKMIAFLEQLKEQHSDDESIRAFNEIENQLRDKKYGLVWEEHSEAVDEKLEENIPVFCADSERRLCKDPSLPWNFIIEGDNLQALYLLEKTHRGKVDCIYIDPPYNNRNRSWKYNNDFVDNKDTYLHSKWMSLMATRLRLAKKLLNPNGSSLIVTIDEKEYLHLGCMLEELFPNAEIEMITSVISAKGVYRVGQFSRVEEYIYFVRINSFIKQQRVNMLDESIKKDSQRPIEWLGLRRREPTSKRGARPNQFYPIFIDNKDGHIVEIGDALPDDVDRNTVPIHDGCVAVWPLDSRGRETLWGLTPEILRENHKKGYVKIKWDRKKGIGTPYYLPSGTITDIETGKAISNGYDTDGTIIAYYEEEGTTPPKRVWNMKSHNAETFGTNILSQLLPDRHFPYPKSIYAVYDCLQFVVGTNPNATVLDFFAGSGTTLQAVAMLNASDGGKRNCILVTNNEHSAKEEDDYLSRGISPGNDEWESTGVSRYVTWPRVQALFYGKDSLGNSLQGKYGVIITSFETDEKSKGKYVKKDFELYPELSSIKMSDGLAINAKYIKCDWIPRKPEDYLLSNALCLHIKEMIEIQNAIEIDNIKNVLLLNKDDFQNIIMNPVTYEQIENVWINQNMILNSNELAMLREKKYKYIPREFFGKELKEAAE
jgi:DNA modification methylase